MRPVLPVIIVVAIVLAACSTAPDGGGEVRAVAVAMSDDMRYDPASFEFLAGETVRFSVTNAGSMRHELFVGDVAAQEAHAAEMAAMGPGMGHDEPGQASVEPGQTEILEVTFEEAGALLAACHEPGHYAAGMTADITIHPAP